MMTKTGTPAKATMQSQAAGETLWLVQWPSQRKGYYATTRTGSDEISLQTLHTRQPVGPAIAKKFTSPVRNAIKRAQQA